MIVPKMGTPKQPTSVRSENRLADVLFTPVQRRVLELVFGQTDRSFQTSELIRLAASGTGAAHRFLTRLADAGLVAVERVGNQKYYRANPECPVFNELVGLLGKMKDPATRQTSQRGVGSHAVHEPEPAYAAARSRPGGKPTTQKLRVSQHRLEAVCRKYGIAKLSMFGSAARNELLPQSDVDLLVEFRPESGASLLDIAPMQDELSQALGGRKVDIATPEILRNPFRRKAIVPDLKTLYEA